MTAALPLPAGPFDVIYADPPWRYDWSNGKRKSVDAHYPTLSLEEICALPVRAVTAHRAVLFLWVTGPKLRDAFPVMDAWGFDYTTQIVWDKQFQGSGWWARARHENLLVATRGDPPSPQPQRVRPPSVLTFPRSTVHSQKPPEIRDLIGQWTRRWADSYVEIFARGRPPRGWTFWGLDATGGPGDGGRPQTYIYSRAEARRLRSEGLSWRAILKELRLPERALSSIRSACRGVQNPPVSGSAPPLQGGSCTGADTG